jgi:retron-type reverse transcriptase
MKDDLRKQFGDLLRGTDGRQIITKRGLRFNKNYLVPQSGFRKLLDEFEIRDTKLRAEIMMRILNGEEMSTRRLNRYLIKMYDKLFFYALNNEIIKFEHFVCILLNRSNAFKLSMLNHTEPKWHRLFNMTKIEKLMYLINNHFGDMSEKFKSRRVMIPKANSSELRPLTVPNLLSRIKASAQLFILDIFVQGKADMIDDDQYCYNGRGCAKAWDRILGIFKKDVKYVYEFDLKKFFDNINRKHLILILYTKGLPTLFIDWIFRSIIDMDNNLCKKIRKIESKEQLNMKLSEFNNM